MATERAYDPRDLEQDLNDPSTWKETANLALIRAAKDLRRGEAYWRGIAMLAAIWDMENPPT